MCPIRKLSTNGFGEINGGKRRPPRNAHREKRDNKRSAVRPAPPHFLKAFENRASKDFPSFAVALKWGIGSSSLKADVKAFDRLSIVRDRLVLRLKVEVVHPCVQDVSGLPVFLRRTPHRSPTLAVPSVSSHRCQVSTCLRIDSKFRCTPTATQSMTRTTSNVSQVPTLTPRRQCFRILAAARFNSYKRPPDIASLLNLFTFSTNHQRMRGP
jgi:hypothetical protein